MAALTLPDVYLLLLHQFCALLIFFFFLLFHQRLRDDNPIYPILKIFIFSLTQSPLLHGSGVPPHGVLEQTRGPAPWPRPQAAASPLTACFCPMKLPCQFYCRAAASFPHLWFVASPGCQGQTSPPPLATGSGQEALRFISWDGKPFSGTNHCAPAPFS